MPENAAQSEAVRQVAEQLFDTWKAQQEREAKREAEDERRWLSGNVAGWLGAIVTIVAGIVGGANLFDLANDANARSLRNENAITTMRVDNSDRLARIETKIDQLVKDSAK